MTVFKQLLTFLRCAVRFYQICHYQNFLPDFDVTHIEAIGRPVDIKKNFFSLSQIRMTIKLEEQSSLARFSSLV